MPQFLLFLKEGVSLRREDDREIGFFVDGAPFHVNLRFIKPPELADFQNPAPAPGAILLGF